MAYFKLLGFVVAALCFFITSAPFLLWALVDRYGAKKRLIQLAHLYAKFVLKLFGISYHVTNKQQDKNKKTGQLIVSNHMSYLDALVMMALRPVCFVTSIEMKQTPVLGQICEAGGCLYVERRSREGLSEEIKDITRALKAGLDVVIFPEATSTNGEAIKRFKRPLFQAAIDSGAAIVPQTINYSAINKKAVTTANRDYVCWYGDMTFFPHLMSVLRQKSIDVELTLSPPLLPNKDSTTTVMSAQAEQMVKEYYRPIMQTQVSATGVHLS